MGIDWQSDNHIKEKQQLKVPDSDKPIFNPIDDITRLILTSCPALPYSPELSDGRVTAAPDCKIWGRGKSGLHRIRVPGNARRGQPQGKCHRKDTAMACHGKGEMVW